MSPCRMLPQWRGHREIANAAWNVCHCSDECERDTTETGTGLYALLSGL